LERVESKFGLLELEERALRVAMKEPMSVGRAAVRMTCGERGEERGTRRTDLGSARRRRVSNSLNEGRDGDDALHEAEVRVVQ
jgi:hypothetical protein